MPLIYESDRYKVYNEEGYITVHYYDESLYLYVTQEYIKDGQRRWRVIDRIHEPTWKVFTWDRPRSNLEFAIKAIVKQEMKRNKGV